MRWRLPEESTRRPAPQERHENVPSSPVERGLAVQRSGGNRAASTLLGAPGRRLQRDDPKAPAPAPSGRVGFEFPLGGAGTLRISVASKGTPLAEAKAGGEDGHAATKLGGIEAQTIYRKGEGFAAALATKLGAVEAGTNPLPWLEVKIKLDALKSKLDLKDPGSSVSLAEVAVEFGVGRMPEEAVREIFGDSFAQLDVSISGEFRYKVGLDDLWNLHKATRAVAEMTEQTEQLGRKLDDLTDLRKRRAELERTLKAGPPRGGTRKARQAREAFENNERALRRLRGQIGELERGIARHKRAIASAGRALAAAEGKIKGTAGHIAAKALGEAGLTALKEIGEKFVPIANVIGAVQDVYDIAVKLANVADLQISLGGGDEGSGGGKEPGGSEGGTTESGGADRPSEGDMPGEGEEPIEVSDKAAAIRDALAGKGAAAWSNEDLRRLDELVADLEADQFAAVLETVERMKSEAGMPLGSSDALFGALLTVIEGAKVAVTGDTQRKNEIEQRVLGFDAAEITGQEIEAGGPEFVRWTRAFQQEQGLKPDGVFGPVTSARWHEANGRTEEPAYRRSKAELRRRAERARQQRRSQGVRKDGGGLDGDGVAVVDPDAKYILEPRRYLRADTAGQAYVPDEKAIAAARGRRVSADVGEVEILDVEVSDEEQADGRLASVHILIKWLRVAAQNETKVKPGDRRWIHWDIAYTEGSTGSVTTMGTPVRTDEDG
jgi:hypothetical protein